MRRADARACLGRSSKFGFLIVLYLFLFWVAWTALRDLRRAAAAAAPAQPVAARRRDATGMYEAAAGAGRVGRMEFEPRLLVERAAGHAAGLAYDVSDGATLGRGDVEIQLDDPFASSRHARISRQGHVS